MAAVLVLAEPQLLRAVAAVVADWPARAEMQGPGQMAQPARMVERRAEMHQRLTKPTLAALAEQVLQWAEPGSVEATQH